MVPPFRKSDDNVSAQSWAFVQNPLMPTREAWERCLSRTPRCLTWMHADYERMGAADKIAQTPPKLDASELEKFAIGGEETPCRYQSPNAAVLISIGNAASPQLEEAFACHAGHFEEQRRLAVGQTQGDFVVPFKTCGSPLHLMEHMAIKLVLNTISTGTMVMLGRVSSNWMSWVAVSNKKLLDRGVRLISELCGVSYSDACTELFKSVEELASTPPGKEPPSPVQYTLRRLGA
jgi:N-acetylmuramic acid 6-phosphate etherase